MAKTSLSLIEVVGVVVPSPYWDVKRESSTAAAVTVPANCKIIYVMVSHILNAPLSTKPKVTQGLKRAPDTWPKQKMGPVMIRLANISLSILPIWSLRFFLWLIWIPATKKTRKKVPMNSPRWRPNSCLNIYSQGWFFFSSTHHSHLSSQWDVAASNGIHFLAVHRYSLCMQNRSFTKHRWYEAQRPAHNQLSLPYAPKWTSSSPL